ncbi:IclR family transcriptional regulator C-terminal domain-containing protein [Streptomyces venezuelae]|uniref:IclR family transcriptional regulator domain-containing protein n=1 Tax=Streptomyces venezuelae TaxID=54571 RepID=UPI0016816D64|nr:IclR family transcriptional regulator C-terminal domain-containing protein [Streptomyces venezuelae]
MSDVSRHDGDHGDVRAPAAPAGLTATPATDVHQQADFWDRPQGDWGPPDTAPPAEEEAWWEERAQANAFYVLGSRALRRGELKEAAHWLGRAADQEHPGSLFRLAVIACRMLGELGTPRAAFLVSEAARCGHADARYLMRRRLGLPAGKERPGAQDPEFYAELADAMGHRQDVAPLAHPVSRRSGIDTAAPARSWSPQTLRAPSLTDTFQQQPQETRLARRWDSVQRVLEVLDLVGDAGSSVSAEYLRRKTSLPRTVIERLLIWLCGKGFLTTVMDGGYTPGPVLQILAQEATQGLDANVLRPTGGEPAPGHTIRKLLAGLRDAAGAAVYVGTYSEGEIRIDQCADSPIAPKVTEWVDFRSAAHATAVGKSLLQQLDFEQRMDHLTRHRPARLTSRTITNHHELFHAIDGHGPHAAQFDLLEYSNDEVCVAVPLGIGGEAGCVALSLPVAQRHRLLEAARILSSRSAGLLVSLLLTANPPRLETGRQGAPQRPQQDLDAAGGNSDPAAAVEGTTPSTHELLVAGLAQTADFASGRDPLLSAPIPQVPVVDAQSADMWRELEDLFAPDFDQPEVIFPDTPEDMNRRHVHRAGTASRCDT